MNKPRVLFYDHPSSRCYLSESYQDDGIEGEDGDTEVQQALIRRLALRHESS
jgi:hypothetical protein